MQIEQQLKILYFMIGEKIPLRDAVRLLYRIEHSDLSFSTILHDYMMKEFVEPTPVQQKPLTQRQIDECKGE